MSLQASPIQGTFNIAGTITVTPNTITWTSNDGPPFAPDSADVGPGATGSFAGLSGTTITIRDLARATEPVGPPPFSPQLYITFDAAPTMQALDIDFIYQGIYSNAGCAATPPAPGQNCTPGPPSSPFNFVNNPPPDAPEATATFVFTGISSDGLSTWKANFTSQFNVPFQTVLAAFGTGGSGQVTNTFSATVTVTAIPEPGPGVLAAGGLALVGLSVFLRRRASGRYV
jgi:hypothetical protein